MRLGAVSDVLGEQALTIAEVFDQAGYDTAAIVRNAQLRRGNGFEQGFASFDDDGGDAREIRWKALDWLQERSVDKPFFLYLHFLDAHWPYPVPESYATRFAGSEDVGPFRGDAGKRRLDAINDGDLPLEGADRRALLALYDGSIRYVDDQLSVLWDRLEQMGLAENTVVCVIADHGEEFGEHGRIGHGHGLSEGLLHVPWIIRVPGVTARRESALVSLVDVFPTLLAAAEIDFKGETEGANQLTGLPVERAIFAEHKAPDRYEQAFRSGPIKYSRTFRARTPQLLDERLPLQVGERWRVRLELDERSGSFRAYRLESLEDEDLESPVELKGSIVAVEGLALQLPFARVELSAGSEYRHAKGGDDTEIRVGRMVKVRGAFDPEGVFRAGWIKFYEVGTEVSLEMRGPLSLVSGEVGGGVVAVGPVQAKIDEETRIRGGDSPKPRLTRNEIFELIELNVDGVRAAGYAVSDSIVEVDGVSERELSRADGRDTVEERARFSTSLERFSRTLRGRALTAPGVSRVLSEATLRELRALGYVD